MTRSRILFLLVLMMGLINIRPTKNFFSLIDAYVSGKSLAVLEGGTGSGKTITALQFITRQARDENVPGVYSIVSESMPHLRQGALRDFKTIVLGNEWEEKRFNYSNNIYEWDNSIFEFFSADQEGKVHGPRRDFLYLNEVIHVPKAIYEDMSDRTRKFEIVDFNPRFEFWMHEYKKREDVAWIHSTFKDALDVLPKETIKKIERMEKINPQRWRIYGLGLVGNVEGLVHPMFLADIDELPEGGIDFYGLDFGYTNDPTALVHCVVKDEDLFCDELLYETGLTNQQIGKKFERLGIKKEEDEIFADSSEPKSIEEIYQLGYNIKPAPKGADSVEHGIQLINNYKQHWTKRSLNAHKEQRNYCYIVDKMNKPTNKPIDDFNHLMDARRYACMSKLKDDESPDIFIR